MHVITHADYNCMCRCKRLSVCTCLSELSYIKSAILWDAVLFSSRVYTVSHLFVHLFTQHVLHGIYTRPSVYLCICIELWHSRLHCFLI